MTLLRKNNDTPPKLTFGDLWWPQYWPERNNDLNTFDCTHSDQSNASFRAFMSLLVFEISRVAILTPPPHTHTPGRRWLRPPPGRGLMLLTYATWSSGFAVFVSCYSLRLGKRAIRLEDDLSFRSMLWFWSYTVASCILMNTHIGWHWILLNHVGAQLRNS